LNKIGLKNMPTLFQIIGFVGVGILVVAYLALQSGRIKGDDWRYPASNLVGALLILFSLYETPNVPSIVIELIWVSISSYGVWRTLCRKNKP
jgi:paired small multidrug resistance pump